MEGVKSIKLKIQFLENKPHFMSQLMVHSLMIFAFFLNKEFRSKNSVGVTRMIMVGYGNNETKW